MATCIAEMLYGEAIEFLSSLQVFGARFGLETAQRLADLAGSPQKKLRFVHVAGTNGKGSTCAMLDAIYRSAGWRVGLYTSPHLVTFRERIQVDRALIPEQQVARLVAEAKGWMKEFGPENHPTFFEAVTIMALRHFAEQSCDVVIWETGLGGRLDATNIVTPLASVITNVQLDHEQWLGDTVEKIAVEKAGIIKPGIPIITGADDPDAKRVIRETASRLGAPFYSIDEHPTTIPYSGCNLRGPHQRRNAALAVKTVEVIRGPMPFNDSAVERGLNRVPWPGRFQVIERARQTIILDGAHNPAGANVLAKTIRAELKGEPLTVIFGAMADKHWPAICRTLAPLAARVITVPVNSPRTANAEALATEFRSSNPKCAVQTAPSLLEALDMARRDGLVLVTGSLYLIGESMELLGLGPNAHERALNEWTAAKATSSRWS